MEHRLNQETQGVGNMQSITPVCTCGWRGGPAYAYNDDQLSDVRRQGDLHLRLSAAQPSSTQETTR